MAIVELLQSSTISVFREDTRYPCGVCGHDTFLEVFRAPRNCGRKDAADIEQCEHCATRRSV